MSEPFASELTLLIEATCIATSSRSRAERTRRAAAAVVDWKLAFQMSQKNRVIPMVYDTLRSIEFESVPAAWRDEFEEEFKRCQRENLAHVRELLGILADLAARGLRASPYKGPVLALALYDDLGQRQFYDLDIVVEEGELDTVAEVMRARGFESGGPRDLADCEWHFVRKSDRTLVEVHWDLLPARHRKGYDIDSYWDRLVPLSIFGTEVEVLGPEDLFIVLCIHGGEKHRWVRLQMAADIARLFVAHPDLDWGVVLERAEGLGREHTVLVGAYLAWVLLDAPLPERVVRSAQTASIRAEVALTLERMARLDSGLPKYSEWRTHLARLDAAAIGRGTHPGAPLGLVRYLVTILRPEWTDRQALALPRPLEFVYWIYRPYRLLRAHGLALFKRL